MGLLSKNLRNLKYFCLILLLCFSFTGGCSTMNSNTNVIGPDGGTVTTSDGRFTLEIPAGALTEDVEIIITRDEDITGDILVYDAQPSGLEFLLPARLSGDVTDIVDNSDDEKQIIVGINFSDDGTVNYLDEQEYDFDFDEGSTKYSAAVKHFSQLALLTGGAFIRHSTVPSSGPSNSKLVDFEVFIDTFQRKVTNLVGSEILVEARLIGGTYLDFSEPMVIYGNEENPFDFPSKTTVPYDCGDPGKGIFSIVISVEGEYDPDQVNLIGGLLLRPELIFTLETEKFTVNVRGIKVVDCQASIIGDDDDDDMMEEDPIDEPMDEDPMDDSEGSLLPIEDEITIVHSASLNQCRTPSATITIKAVDSDGFPVPGVQIGIGTLPSYLQVSQSVVTTNSDGEAIFTVNFNCNGFNGGIPSTLMTDIEFFDDAGFSTTVKFTTRVVS